MLVVLGIGGCDLSTIFPNSGTDNPDTNNPGNNQTVPAPAPVFTRPISSITAPAGQLIQVAWFATSSQKTVVSHLFYDEDGLKNSGDEVLLTQSSKVAGDYSAGTYTWDTTGFTPATYHLLLVANDGVNPAVTVYCNYTVTIVDSTPTLSVSEPFSPVSVSPAENVVLKWTQYAPLAASTVTLYYDNDKDHDNGYITKIATLPQAAPPAPAAPTSGTCRRSRQVSTTSSPDSTMAPTPSTDYSPAPVGISGPAVQVFNPAAPLPGTAAARWRYLPGHRRQD
ncbi:MAG: hypothetical protein QM765_44510 [Myxococcales bacterium]